ncbi:MAG: hypothetical protein EAZ27_00030 [Cytophagales bacterium]|nr:MAG: hypothetical protein EAZ27_00030 [Cytophagales bacterium]
MWFIKKMQFLQESAATWVKTVGKITKKTRQRRVFLFLFTVVRQLIITKSTILRKVQFLKI